MKAIRDGKYDFMKGMLMLGVVWGHMITALKYGANTSSWILIFFRTYDMPMFAFITGYFLHKSVGRHSFLGNTLNKIGLILIPTVLWEILYNFSIGDFSIFPMTLQILRFRGSFIDLVNHLYKYWFLWAIFFSIMVVLIIEKLFRKTKWLQLIAFAVVVCITHAGIGESRNIGFLLFPTICGFYYTDIKSKTSTKAINVLTYLLFAVFVLFQCFWSTEYNVWNAGCNVLAESGKNALPIIFRGLMGLVASLVMMRIFELLYKCLKTSENKITLGFVRWMEKNWKNHIRSLCPS